MALRPDGGLILACLWAATLSAQPPGTVAVMPGEVAWKADPRAEGMQSALVSGDPNLPGLYVLRVKMAPGAKLPPHRHPDQRLLTVLSGVFYLGFGEAFDAQAVKAYPAGAHVVIPAKAPHFGWARDGEVVTQDNGWGPTGSIPAGTK